MPCCMVYRQMKNQSKLFRGQEIPNGAKFFEMDTKTVYFYNKEEDQWI